jgi:hypothetical protein
MSLLLASMNCLLSYSWETLLLLVRNFSRKLQAFVMNASSPRYSSDAFSPSQ